jgi:hypothetical protein
MKSRRTQDELPGSLVEENILHRQDAKSESV